MRWHPRQWWSGQDVVIIGGGPSLRGFDWSALRTCLTVGCNDAFKLGPSVCTVCVFGDMKWYITHYKELEMFPNPIFTNQPSLHVGSPDWILTVPRKIWGLHRDALGWGGNTGCSAINLALILGAMRGFLLGFDMKTKDDKTNWHDCNIGNPNDEAYKRFMEGFEKLSRDLPVVFPGRSVVNLGPDSALDMFPTESMEAALSN